MEVTALRYGKCSNNQQILLCFFTSASRPLVLDVYHCVPAVLRAERLYAPNNRPRGTSTDASACTRRIFRKQIRQLFPSTYLHSSVWPPTTGPGLSSDKSLKYNTTVIPQDSEGLVYKVHHVHEHSCLSIRQRWG